MFPSTALPVWDGWETDLPEIILPKEVVVYHEVLSNSIFKKSLSPNCLYKHPKDVFLQRRLLLKAFTGEVLLGNLMCGFSGEENVMDSPPPPHLSATFLGKKLVTKSFLGIRFFLCFFVCFPVWLKISLSICISTFCG